VLLSAKCGYLLRAFLAMPGDLGKLRHNADTHVSVR
jgi:hypothetical protein